MALYEHLVALHIVAQVDDPAGMTLPFLAAKLTSFARVFVEETPSPTGISARR